MAEWTPAYINDLPDLAFAYIAPGGHKDGEGKTVPREKRYLSYRDATGKVDAGRLASAIQRLPGTDLSQAARQQAQDVLEAAAKTTVAAGSARSKERMPDGVMGLQTRAYVLELRAGGDGRTVLGRAVPYGQTAEIPGGRERFIPGAFSRQISAGQLHTVKLHGSHSARLAGDFAVGKTVALEERADGLHGAWAMYETPRGDEALHLVKTGEVTGLSVGFKAVDGGTRRGADGAYERHAAHLDHVALTAEPVYAAAIVTAVRSVQHPIGGYRRDLEKARGILQRLAAGR